MKFFVSLFFILGVLSESTFARENPFKALKFDMTVPDKCQEYLPRYFKVEDITYFTVGTSGMKQRGFTAEVPLQREQARILWAALKPRSSDSTRENAMRKIRNDEELLKYYQILDTARVEREASYHSEGEILEILAYSFLPGSKLFDELLEKHSEAKGEFTYNVFLTGGVSYHNKNGGTLGELDVIVGDVDSCTIFGIGEAKLGRSRGKALRQLDRIKSFINRL